MNCQAGKTNNKICIDFCEIKLIDLSKGNYDEYQPIFSTKRNENINSTADNTLNKIIEEKKRESELPLIIRKRKLYDQYKDKETLEKVINSSEDDITQHIKNFSNRYLLPITLRKRLMYKKI